MVDLKLLKQTVTDTKNEAEQEHDGPVMDLCAILARIIHNFEHQGVEYIVERYWKR